jgi:tetratricopeptide (TPR) repeat protein
MAAPRFLAGLFFLVTIFFPSLDLTAQTPRDSWLEHLELCQDFGEKKELVLRSGWMAAASDFHGWILPYALVMGGGNWFAGVGDQAMELGPWPVLQLDRIAGFVVLSTVEPIDAVGFGMPVAAPDRRPGVGQKLWVAGKQDQPEDEGVSPLQWIAAERVSRPGGDLIPGQRIRIRVSVRAVLSPGAVIATADGGFASLERGVAGSSELFDCVLWPDPDRRVFPPDLRFSGLDAGASDKSSEEMWASAELFLAADRPADALPLLELAWEEGPPRWQVAVLAALAAARTDRPSVPWVERAIALAPGRQEVQSTAFRLAERAADPKLRAEWLQKFDQAAAEGPDIVLLHARVEMDEQRYSRALECLSDPALAQVLPGEVLYWSGRCYLAMGRMQQALQSFLEATRVSPGKAEYFDALGSAALEYGDYRLAAEAGRKAISLNPDMAAAYHHLGLALAQLNQPLFAIEIFRRGLMLNPEDVASLTNMGKLLVWMGAYEEAEPLLERALELSPVNSLAWIHLAEIRSKRGDLAGARKAAERAVEVVPEDPDAWSCLAHVVYREGKTADAIPLLEKALAIEPGREGFWLNRVNWERDFRDPQRVLQVVRKAQAALPGRPWLMAEEGNALMDLDRLREAENLFRDGVDRNPKSADLWVGLASCLRRGGSLKEATETLEEALRRVDDRGAVAGRLGFYRGLASILEGAARWREAFPGAAWDEHMEERARRLLLGQADDLPEFFAAASEETPRDPYLGWFLAQAYWDSGDVPEAERRFELLSREQEGRRNLLALESLVDLLRRRGALDRALIKAERLVALNPFSEIGYVAAGTARVNEGLAADALETISPGLDYFPDSFPLRMIRATALVQLEEWDQVAPLLDRLLMEQPRDPDLNYLAGLCQYRRGRLLEAKNHLEWVLRIEPGREPARLLLDRIRRIAEES